MSENCKHFYSPAAGAPEAVDFTAGEVRCHLSQMASHLPYRHLNISAYSNPIQLSILRYYRLIRLRPKTFFHFAARRNITPQAHHFRLRQISLDADEYHCATTCGGCTYPLHYENIGGVFLIITDFGFVYRCSHAASMDIGHLRARRFIKIGNISGYRRRCERRCLYEGRHIS